VTTTRRSDLPTMEFGRPKFVEEFCCIIVLLPPPSISIRLQLNVI
jgi:hypothetical protein